MQNVADLTDPPILPIRVLTPQKTQNASVRTSAVLSLASYLNASPSSKEYDRGIKETPSGVAPATGRPGCRK